MYASHGLPACAITSSHHVPVGTGGAEPAALCFACRYPLKAAYLNGQEMTRNQYQFYEQSGPLQSSNTVSCSTPPLPPSTDHASLSMTTCKSL